MAKLDFLCDGLPARVEGHESTRSKCRVVRSRGTDHAGGFDGRYRLESPAKHSDQFNIEVLGELVVVMTLVGGARE